MKRDPEAVIAALRAVLLRYPDYRVGQAIVNALDPRANSDAFYVEDEALAKGLRQIAFES
jgi:hypothetical protein